jgi:hypothetical protein
MAAGVNGQDQAAEEFGRGFSPRCGVDAIIDRARARMTPDPKREKRIRDPELLRRMHFEFEECVICGVVDFSVHHVLKRSQGGDDVRENLVALCGHGTAGCHGLVELADADACAALGAYLDAERPDVVTYLQNRLGSPDAAAEWLQQRGLRVIS